MIPIRTMTISIIIIILTKLICVFFFSCVLFFVVVVVVVVILNVQNKFPTHSNDLCQLTYFDVFFSARTKTTKPNKKRSTLIHSYFQGSFPILTIVNYRMNKMNVPCLQYQQPFSIHPANDLVRLIVEHENTNRIMINDPINVRPARKVSSINII